MKFFKIYVTIFESSKLSGKYFEEGRKSFFCVLNKDFVSTPLRICDLSRTSVKNNYGYVELHDPRYYIVQIAKLQRCHCSKFP